MSVVCVVNLNDSLFHDADKREFLTLDCISNCLLCWKSLGECLVMLSFLFYLIVHVYLGF